MTTWPPSIDRTDLGTLEAPLQFDTDEDRNEWLIVKYADVATKLAELTALKYQIRDIMDVVAGSPDKLSGTVKLDGVEFQARLTRVLRSKYEKQDDDIQPFLQTVFEEMECFRDCISVKFEEKTATMTKALKAVEELPDKGNTQIKAMAQTVLDRRSLVKGATSVKTEVK